MIRKQSIVSMLIFILLNLLNIVVLDDFKVIAILSVYLFVVHFYFNMYLRSKKTTYIIFLAYSLGLYLQYLVVDNNPGLFVNKGLPITLFYNSTFKVNSLITSVIFLVLFLISFSTLSQIRAHRLIKFPTIKKVRIRNSPILFLLIVSLLEYLIRIRFNIAIPGKAPIITIPYLTNIVYFSIIGLKLFLLKNILNIYISKRLNRVKLNIVFGVIMSIVYSLPSILIGWRGSFVTILINITLYYFILLDRTNRNKLIKSFIVTGLPIGLVFIYITGIIRAESYGTSFDFFAFLFNRFVGWPDAFAIEAYLESDGLYAFKSIVSGDSIASFHTTYVRGFPKGISHANSRPIFSSLKLLGGYYAMVFGTVILSSIFVFLENRIAKRKEEFVKQDVFLFAYLLLSIVMTVVFSGDFDLLIKSYLVIVFVYGVLNSIIVFTKTSRFNKSYMNGNEVKL